MGLEGVAEYLKKRYPGCITNSYLSEFAFKRIAVDISGFIYRYISIYGKEDNQWLRCFVNLILLMRSNNVTFIPVFDGKPPKEKSEEIAERRKARENITDKVKSVEDDYDNFVENGAISDQLLGIINKANDKAQKSEKSQLLHSLIEKRDEKQTTLTADDIETINQYIAKQKSYVFSITSEDIAKLKELFNIFKVPFIQATYESEQVCCALVNKGLCDAVLSNDTDCLAHRVSTFIFHLDTNKSEIKYIKKEDLMRELKFENDNQITDFGILVGCDYNRSKRMRNVGPVKAHQMITEHKNLEGIRDNLNKDIDSINYKRCRELFNYTLEPSETTVKIWRKPDLEEVKNYLRNNSIFVDYSKIDKSFHKTIKIIFQE
jgi:5'-3' exonuclease